jgi:Gpi18-like mannosyltransferase
MPTFLHWPSVESTSEPIDSLTKPGSDGLVNRGSSGPIAAPPARRRTLGPDRWRETAARSFASVRFAVTVFLATRVLLLVVAILNNAFRHVPLLMQFANWDGLWFRSVANFGSVLGGYPHYVSDLQTNLGFFPFYPLMMRGFSYLFLWSTPYGRIGAITVAGIFLSLVGGLVSTVLVQRMATEWWDEAAGRRSVLLFCLFPGSVIFSMVYAEGIAIPLAIACIYALTHRRWVLAGVLAGIATAVEPEAFVLIPVCAISALLELRRQGWSLRRAARSLWAPFLSLFGAAGVGAFFWAWTGSPYASFIAQSKGWHEKTSPLALWHDAKQLGSEISFTHLTEPNVNLNLVVGLLGAALLLLMLVLIYRQRRAIPIEAIVWTLGIGFLTVTSWNIPPNPRLLITAFPGLMVLAYYLRGRWLTVVLWINGFLLAGMSALTFVGLTLRP